MLSEENLAWGSDTRPDARVVVVLMGSEEPFVY